MERNGCVVCSLPSEQRCSACAKATYCSPEHQKQDWKKHKPNCVPYKISVHDKVGRHLIATRNIPEGTIILVEKPIVLGPKLYSAPTCLGCYKKVDGSYFCAQCGFPMCSEQCSEMEVHRDNECKIFAKKGSSPKRIENYDSPHPLYQSILPLRCLLLREKRLDKWKALNSMEHHVEARKSRSEVWQEFQVNIVNFLRDWHGLGESYSEDTVNRVIGFIEVNSFQIKTVKKIEFCGLFRLGGLMSHDCQPNTHHAFTPEGNLVLRASVDIKKNTDITMSYVDPSAGTTERRQILEQSKYFGCDCARCQDPTELGAFMSGVLCNCDVGYLLPKNPLSENSEWICYSSITKKPSLDCHNTQTAAEIFQKVEDAKNFLQQLSPTCTSDEILNSIALHCKTFHPNHFLLLPIWKRLLQLNFEQISNSSTLDQKHYDDVGKTKLVAERLLKVYNIVDPGLTRARGMLLRQLCQMEKRLLQWEDVSQPQNERKDQRISKICELEEEIQKIFALDDMICEKP